MKTKHTKGERKIRKAIPIQSKTRTIEITPYDILAVGINTESDEEFTAVAFCGHFKNKEAQANAKLIAEAGTVANETGKTPRQLADERAELLEALIEAKERLYGGLKREDLTVRGKELFDKINNAIKKQRNERKNIKNSK